MKGPSGEHSNSPGNGDSLPTEKVEGGLREALREESWEYGEGVFGALERLTGSPSRILLTEADGEEAPGPVVAPAAPADQRLSRGKGQYRVDGELARGGMGVVLKGHDTDLGRDVALKVMHPEFSSRAESVQRFVEEAQIGGQLQHPGIVPVYELGLMADERPYFAMKLIKGRTLGSLFADRETPAADQRRFLGIFEQVCQTVAYAHARGVIHRDLKPSNIMVGAFGEVQVVDWGLAKVLQRGGVADEKRAQSAQVSVIETVRSEHGSSHSRAGSVMGTPAYMAPEQARGEVQEVTERADVFSLGAILCELLSGAPPYTGDRDAVMMQAAGAELQEAKVRLADCDGEEELVALALRCLAPAPSARPRNAEALAKAVQEHLSSVEERAKEARLEAERARARATAERKARKLTAALAVTVLIATLGGGGGYVFVEGQRQTRRERTAGLVNEAITEATSLRTQGSYAASLAAARRAEALAQPDDVDPGLRARVANLIAAVQEEDQLEKEQRARDERNAVFLAHLDQVRTLERLESMPLDLDEHTRLEVSPESPESHWERRDRAYAQVLDDFGLRVKGASADETADKLRETGIGPEIALRVDDWARVVRKLEGRDSARGLHLLDIAHQADPDPWRARMRAAIATDDVEELRRLASDMDLESAGPTTWMVLAGGLGDLDALDEKIDVLSRVQRRYPGDSAVSVNLGRSFEELTPPRHDLAVRYKQAGVAAKPNSHLAWHSLGYSLRKLGEFEAAIRALDRAVELDPQNVRSHWNLSSAFEHAGRMDESVEAARAALRLAPDDPYYITELGYFLHRAGREEESIEPLTRAVELTPGSPYRNKVLGMALRKSGRYEDALPYLERAEELDSSNGAIVYELAILYELLGRREEAFELARRAFQLNPEDAHIRITLSFHLMETGATEEVISVLLDLDETELHDSCALSRAQRLSTAYLIEGRLDEAEAVLEELMRTHPESGVGWHGLGAVLLHRGEPERAIEYLERAVELLPEDPSTHHNLGVAYKRSGRAEESLESFERVVEVDPENPEGLVDLAVALQEAGRFEDSIAVLEEALYLDPDRLRALIHLAKSLLTLQDYEGTLALAERMSELAPSNPDALAFSGEAHIRLGNPERALLPLRELTRTHPRWATGHDLLGHALADSGDLEGARAAWSEALRLEPTNVEYQSHLFPSDQGIGELRAAVEANPEDAAALNNLAWELVLDPQAEGYAPEEATELALRCVELAPDDAYLWNTLGLALVRSQRWDEAIEALQKSIALESGEGYAEDWYFLAMAWHGKGDLTRARECHERARGFEESEELEPWEREVRALLGLDAKD